MHFSTLLAGLAATAVGTASAAAVEKRLPRYGSFGYYPVDGCPNTQQGVVEFTYGNDCGKCNNFASDAVMKSINVFGPIDSGKCIITVYNTFDCSDPGIVSGPGCWSPPGGIAGWTITCPWDDESGQFPPCKLP